MKLPAVFKDKRLTARGLALLLFLLASIAAAGVFRGVNEYNRLLSRNMGERTLNDFISIARESSSVEHALEVLQDRTGTEVTGIGGYSRDGEARFILGTAPEAIDTENMKSDQNGPRQYILNRSRGTLIIIQSPPPRHEDDNPPPREPDSRSPVFEALFHEVNYWEIRQPGYWARNMVYKVGLAAAEILIALALWYVFWLNEKNRQYRQKIEDQRNLVVIGTAASTLAHEIKNPLSIIRLQTELISRISGDEVGREIKIINEETQRLTMLAGHVNDFLRDPEGSPEVLNPLEVLPEIGAAILGMPLKLSFDRKDLRIQFDRNRFRSVVENIILNAAQSGSSYEEITVSLERKGPFICINFCDRGTGIKPENLARVYDPFFTTKSNGTGVGLGVVHRFITAAGGKLSINNREGSGVCVSLELPEYVS